MNAKREAKRKKAIKKCSFITAIFTYRSYCQPPLQERCLRNHTHTHTVSGPTSESRAACPGPSTRHLPAIAFPHCYAVSPVTTQPADTGQPSQLGTCATMKTLTSKVHNFFFFTKINFYWKLHKLRKILRLFLN